MKVAFASDHAGFDFKKELTNWLRKEGHQILDFGAFSDERVDYPDFAFPASEAVASGVADFGVLICGSGTGMSITANKVVGIRAASCFTPEMAKLAREHNNANIITFGARLTEMENAKKMILEFLSTDFEGGRHMIRVEKIHSLTGY